MDQDKALLAVCAPCSLDIRGVGAARSVPLVDVLVAGARGFWVYNPGCIKSLWSFYTGMQPVQDDRSDFTHGVGVTLHTGSE